MKNPPSFMRGSVKENGQLNYEYNMMLLDRYKAQSAKIPAGHHTIEVETLFKNGNPLAPAYVTLRVDETDVGTTTVCRTVPAAFTASETFDVGVDLGAPVSLDYADAVPFDFDGKINNVEVQLLEEFGTGTDCIEPI